MTPDSVPLGAVAGNRDFNFLMAACSRENAHIFCHVKSNSLTGALWTLLWPWYQLAFLRRAPLYPHAYLKAGTLYFVHYHIFDLSSSNKALSLSMSVACCGHPMPSPSCSFGLGIFWGPYKRACHDRGVWILRDTEHLPCGNGPM